MFFYFLLNVRLSRINHLLSFVLFGGLSRVLVEILAREFIWGRKITSPLENRYNSRCEMLVCVRNKQHCRVMQNHVGDHHLAINSYERATACTLLSFWRGSRTDIASIFEMLSHASSASSRFLADEFSEYFASPLTL